MTIPTRTQLNLKAEFLYPDSIVRSPRQDYEYGGAGIGDTSKGHNFQWWAAMIERGAPIIQDGQVTGQEDDKIIIRSQDGQTLEFYQGQNITEVALAFDSNMNPHVAWTEDSLGKFRWYDLSINDYRVSEYPGAMNLRLALDDKRSTQSNKRDILLSYIDNNSDLYVRVQRENYATAHLMGRFEPQGGRLMRVGMTKEMTFQWEYDPLADPYDKEWPVIDDLWEVPMSSGFSPGEMVGVWTGTSGFLGFRQIEVFDDGVDQRMIVRISGKGAESALIGYPYNAKYKPLPIASSDDRGTLLGRKRRIVKAILSVQDAANVMVNDIPLLPQTGADMGYEHTARTGEFSVRMLGWNDKDEMTIEAVSPYSAFVRALVREFAG